MKKLSRRKFIQTVGAAGAASFVLPRFSIAQTKSPNSQINIAFVGVGNIGGMALNGCRGENFVGFCDIDPAFAARSKQFAPYKENKIYTDYREMFDKIGKDIDAVCVSTPDHTHFKITLDAMSMGKHVCTQKPLAYTIWQCRELKRAQDYYKVKTQMMNQGHASEQIRMMKDWFDTGILGEVKEAHAWFGGPDWNSQYFQKPEKLPLAAEPTPEGVYWDGWIGEAKATPFSRNLHPAKWRSIWDYGTGMLGDWFCHTADIPVWFLDLKGDCTVELVDIDKNFDGTVVIPNASTVKWTFPATSKRGQIEFYWYDGGMKPKVIPQDLAGLKKAPRGGMWLVGSKHTLSTGPRPTSSMKIGNDAFFNGEFRQIRRSIEKKTPRAPESSLYKEWFADIRGEGPRCGSNFDYAAQITEVALLGALAQRFGGKIVWDAKNCKITNRPELNAYVKTTPREGWEEIKF